MAAMVDPAILLPAAVLIVWTMIVWGWMLIDRARTFRAHKISLAKVPAGSRGSDLNAILPPGTEWPAHNYVHLMEQPTVFYPTVVLLALGGYGGFDVALAWFYVAVRVAHSLWQITVNRLVVRAALFMISSVALAALAVRALLSLIA